LLLVLLVVLCANKADCKKDRNDASLGNKKLPARRNNQGRRKVSKVKSLKKRRKNKANAEKKKSKTKKRGRNNRKTGNSKSKSKKATTKCSRQTDTFCPAEKAQALNIFLQ